MEYRHWAVLPVEKTQGDTVTLPVRGVCRGSDTEMRVTVESREKPSREGDSLQDRACRVCRRAGRSTQLRA